MSPLVKIGLCASLLDENQNLFAPCDPIAEARQPPQGAKTPRPNASADYQRTPETERMDRAFVAAEQAHAQFLVVPLVQPAARARLVGRPTADDGSPRAFNLADLVVADAVHADAVVGEITPWDIPGASIAAKMRQMEDEFAWAQHVGLRAVLVRLVCGKHIDAAQSRAVARLALLDAGGGCQVWLQFSSSDWRHWNAAQAFAGGAVDSLRAVVALPDDPQALPAADSLAALPIAALSLSVDAFTPNRAGCPVLPRPHQAVVKAALRCHGCGIILTSGSGASAPDTGACVQYLRHLEANVEPPTAIEQFSEGYVDVLQSPLQPLMHNLSTQTYQVFEADPVKYAEYQRAITRALAALPASPDGSPAAVAVVGAGRGPLVSACLRAAADSGRAITLTAVEKNAGALVTLQRMNEAVWGGRVQIVPGDMRRWVPPAPIDVLVSELLGSFGDNELSPECLDGVVERVLRPGTGVSIPQSYEALLAPVASHALFREVRAQRGLHGPAALRPWETPYVVKMGRAQRLAATQPCWSFEHPRRDATVGNTREASLTFDFKGTSVVHGLAAYFSATLYDDIVISTAPETHTPDMLSWFEMLFPLRTPVHVPAGQQLCVNIFRACDARRVWYEWNAYARVCTNLGTVEDVIDGSALHNPGGRTYWIGL